MGVPLDLHSLEGSLAGLAVVLGKEKACEVTRLKSLSGPGLHHYAMVVLGGEGQRDRSES